MNEIAEQKKQILVGINQLDHVGGAELYTYDLINELNKHDNLDVEFFAHNQGRLSKKLEDELGISFMTQDKYDLIIATHNSTVETLHGQGPIVQVCHGAILELEHPSVYADYHVGITEEVCDSLTSKNFDNTLILNGIDIGQKKPYTKVNDTLKVVLSLCQSEKANKVIKNVCDLLDLEFIHFNKHKNPTFNIEQEINKADIVIGIGRSIFDAMACGRPCIVFDNRDYNGNKADGYLYPHLFDEFIKNNCSGRYFNRKFNEDDILGELQKYNPEHGADLRKIAVEKLNIKDTAMELLAIHQHINWKTNAKKQARTFRKQLKTLRRSFKKEIKSYFKR